MPRTLRSEGILHTELLEIDGGVVENYNRALQTITGKTTTQNKFTVDKRGESPELEEELGANYLQTGSANRYMIVVSPDQKDAGIYHKEFSFDEEILDSIYQNFLGAISLATRVDGLYGKLNSGVRTFSQLEDLLSLKRVHVDLQAPSGFIEKALNELDLIKQLEENPDLLIDNDCRLPKELLETVKEIGDVRGYNICNINLTKEVETFYTRFFDGAFIFRNFNNRLKENLPRRPANGNQIDLEFKDEVIEHVDVEKPKSMMIYNHKPGQKTIKGPAVDYIKLQSDNKVVDFLVENHYVNYSEDLIEPRLKRLKHTGLLALGYDISTMTHEERMAKLSENEDKMPKEWHKIRDVKRGLTAGHELDDLMKDAKGDVKKMLIEPCCNFNYTTVAHLITKLNPDDYERMLKYNQRDLEKTFESSDLITQDYIISAIKSPERYEWRE